MAGRGGTGGDAFCTPIPGLVVSFAKPFLVPNGPLEELGIIDFAIYRFNDKCFIFPCSRFLCFTKKRREVLPKGDNGIGKLFLCGVISWRFKRVQNFLQMYCLTRVKYVKNRVAHCLFIDSEELSKILEEQW